MIKKKIIILMSAALIAAAVLFAFTGFKTDNESELPAGKDLPGFNILPSFALPDSFSFAGERMPLENFDTRESLDREIIITAYRHSSTILILKRATRYFPLIEPILKEYNVPDDLKYLAVAESDLTNAVSPAGATGYWQIMAATGREQGMEINSEVDERYHLEKSTRFACDYLLKSYERYGSWTLAAASYNGGRNAVDDQMEIQKVRNYYDLLLSEETARYVFRAAAYKIIISNPSAYGFDLEQKDYYPPLQYTEVKVDTAVSDFSRFAGNFGTSYKMLKFLNPWLRKPYLTNRSGKLYMIKIPEQGSRNSTYAESAN